MNIYIVVSMLQEFTGFGYNYVHKYITVSVNSNNIVCL